MRLIDVVFLGLILGSRAYAGGVQNGQPVNASVTNAAFLFKNSNDASLYQYLFGASGSPDASSQLELRSTTKGFLPPRMTTTQRDAISSPATGLFLYNTSTGALNFYNGSSWLQATAQSGSITASRAVVTDGSGALTSASTTSTQIGYLSGATGTTGTGNLAFSSSPTFTGTLGGASATFSGTLGVTGVTTLSSRAAIGISDTSTALAVGGTVTSGFAGTTQVGVSSLPTWSTSATSGLSFSSEITAGATGSLDTTHFLARSTATGGATIGRATAFRAATATLQSASNNSAVLADNQAYTGDFFLNQSGTEASVLGGSLSVSGNFSTSSAVSRAGYETSTAVSGTITASANRPGLIINSAGGTTLTIRLPSSPIDGQQYFVGSVGAFTTVTWQDAGGTAANVIGGQSALGGTNRGQSFVYSAALTKWLSI